MRISDILSPERVRCGISSQSKKAALETVGRMIAEADPGLTPGEVFDSLIARERLGSTGLGSGVALPHGRRKHGDKTLAAFVRLERAIDYDAVDRRPVDLLFALLVPEKSTDEHLHILALLAERFSDHTFLETLRTESSAEKIFKLLAD